VNVESTEGTYVAPAGASDGYIQPLQDGFEFTPSKESIQRNILTSSIGKVSPRVGMKSVAVTLPVEFRASGTEGTAPDFDILLKGAMGDSRSIASNITTKNSGNTGSVLQIEDGDIASLSVGDIIVVKETAGHHPCAITAKTTGTGTATITILPAKASGSFSNSVVLSKSKTYFPANSSHPAISTSFYWANTITNKAMGCKVTGMDIQNFQTGKVAAFNFSLEGLSFTEADGAAPHTPTYDSGLPPIILSAKVYQDGTEININTFGLKLANSLGFITSTGDANGKISSRITSREITGTINPYKDDTSVANFTKFNANTAFSLFVSAYNPSATTGEITMGSVVGIYLPSCIITDKKIGDQQGILTDELSFSANRGSDGSTEEMFLGFV
jgi:hypothetical protein